MKLRIHENSLRLRLDDTELAELVETGKVCRLIRFGPDDGACLVYSVEMSDRTKSVDADLQAGVIRVFIKEEEARRLEFGGEESIEGERRIRENEVLRVLVEKDFAP